MPKKPKWRPPRRRPRDRGEEDAEQARRMDAAARGLLAGRSLDQLNAELHDRTLLLEEADRVAQLDPSPANLTRYRDARAQVDAIRRALQMASSG